MKLSIGGISTTLLVLIGVLRLGHSIEILNLPGLKDKLNFKQFSGYLNGSETNKLHYWFTESQGNPAKDPFVVWLNGGPGCSSLDGLLSELGPIRVKKGGEELYLNEQSWNKLANVLFLEAPAGVGFSYASDGNIKTDDDKVITFDRISNNLTSQENYNALKDFFAHHFPQYRNNDLYITGESYGGVYVPTFVERIIDGLKDFPLNIKGMAIGNGLLSDRLNTNTLMEFGYYHGLIDDKVWALVQSTCCNGCTDTCDFSQITSKYCQSIITNVTTEVWGNTGLNVYDLYRDCFTPSNAQDISGRYKADVRHFKYVNNITRTNYQWQKNPAVPHPMYDGDPPCIDDTDVTKYLNRKDVRAAIGIPSHLPEWSMCSDPVGEKYGKIYSDLSKQVYKALDHKLHVLVYNGDTDMACNFLMGQQFCRELHIPRLLKKKMWHYNHQIAGFVTRYQNLDFVTIKGAGHMVPQWKSGQSYKMIEAFLKNKALN